MFSVLYGRLSDIFGRKIVYLSALALLCIADLLCGLSQNAAMFYVFRGLAGIAGGGVGSLTMIIVSDIVTLENRGKYQGILGASLGLGNVIGPFIAGAFIMRSTWRGLFWLISPLAACSMVVGVFLIPNNTCKVGVRENVSKIDFYGIIASSIGIIFLLIPISGGGSYFQWNSAMVISMLVIGACSLVAFVFIEWKVASLPMLPVSAAMTAPMVGCQALASIASGQYISRTKRYGEVIWAGFGLWTLHTHRAVIVVVVAITGIGIGWTFQPTLIAFQAHCTKSHRAVVISNRNFFRCLGGACGLAVSAAILQATLRSNLPNGYRYLAHSTYSLPPQSDISASDWSQILDAYAKASRGVFILQVPLIGLCFAACLFIRDRGLERPKEPGEEEKEERNTAQQKSDDEAPPSEPPEKFDKGPNHGAECRGS
ncbi:hypothetical protein ACP6JB_005836 [Aspergillus fumigatus]